ncbi:AI-2E family transporter [Rubritalea tangerina]|uniref:AI-2E family transporter n=2 Tax=Rubritalea tangerina TaxID=430798 RepID=A0ABW4Z9P2_9BACT
MGQKSKPKAAEASKILIVLASLVLVIAGAKASADFVVPVLLAFFIATVSFPITHWLREHRVPRALAVFITVLVDFAFLAGVVLLGIMLIGELQTKWESKYYDLTKDRVTQLADNTSAFMDKWGMLSISGESAEGEAIDGGEDSGAGGIPRAIVEEDLSESEIAVSEGIEAATNPAVGQATRPGLEILTEELLKYLSVNKVVQLGTDFLGKLVSFLGTTFIVMLLTVFMLSEARMFGRRFNAICEARGPNIQRMLSATKDIQRYLGIKTLVSLMTGFLAGVLCWAVGLEFPLLWGILAFALNYIPAIGSVIAGIPPVLLSLLVTGDWKHAVVVGGGYLLINGLLGNFLEPTLLGRRFGISTLVVVISVIFWGWIWGPIGMLLAVPLTMLVKVAMDNSADFRWIAVAISKEDRNAVGASDEQILMDAVAQSHEAEEKRQKLSEDTTKLSHMFPES